MKLPGILVGKTVVKSRHYILFAFPNLYQIIIFNFQFIPFAGHSAATKFEYLENPQIQIRNVWCFTGWDGGASLRWGENGRTFKFHAVRFRVRNDKVVNLEMLCLDQSYLSLYNQQFQANMISDKPSSDSSATGCTLTLHLRASQKEVHVCTGVRQL